MPVISLNTEMLIIALAALSVLCLVLSIIALSSAATTKRKVKRWKAIHATADLDLVYDDTLHKVRSLQESFERLERHVTDLQKTLETKISTAVVHRYNAFSETGSDLSFSVALLDDNHDGLVLSSIYGRDESRTYAKPVHRGESAYALTEEEQAVINSSRNQTAKLTLTRA